jgi:PhnB protein
MSYVDGFVTAVPEANKEAYKQFAGKAATAFRKLGALKLVECWGEDVPEGVLTSFPKAVSKKEGETVVFSWIVWPSKTMRDEGWARMMDDPSMRAGTMPFDGKRMIYGGFQPVLGEAADNPAAIQPYLFFRGRCEEAIEYYKETLGAEVAMLLRFKDNPDKPGPDKVPPAFDDKIMHAHLRIHGADVLMSDGMKTGPVNFDCMSLSLSVPGEAEAERVFNALAGAGGTVQMPLMKTFFAPRFGSVADKFGVTWLIIVPRPGEGEALA